MTVARYMALDSMRGLTLALMIIVNTPGSWSHVYAPLLHAPWHGWTFTDLVFPFFLFIVGAALYFSRARSAALPAGAQCTKILRRSLLLVLLGIALEFYPFLMSIENLRLPGVLQRIGLAFGCAALLHVFIAPRWNMLVVAVLLLCYSGILQLADQAYSLEGNVQRQVDIFLFGANHLWAGKGLAFDPEGLLGTISATATVLIGFQAAQWLSAPDLGKASPSHWRWDRRQVGLVLAGVLLISIAYALPEPINKSLWTSSYVLLTGGLALAFLSLLLFVERFHWGQWLQRPFVILGQNPLFIYALSWLWVRTYGLIPTDSGTLYDSLYQCLAIVFPAQMASLLFALGHLFVFWCVAWWLHHRGIFIRL